MPTWAISVVVPIRLDWFGLVFPALVLNYFGQGALDPTIPRRETARSTTYSRAGSFTQ